MTQNQPNALSKTGHVEYHDNPTTGKRVLVSCYCSIGKDHDYPEWVAATHTSAA
ncbi:hypothetical protein [Agromyces sp. S2-1-8]|uniref:hypothetical protein n=1 Tax=Agromyces sp. S2-1-8 TaxID=2897180 RepID=UPI001E557420|nr:hypothetical protein [Agromyces sp. S2-1-8]MCD5348401.1 hypothetical protein [Agromyces sp. S2-1-8]